MRWIQRGAGGIDPGTWLTRGVYFGYQHEVRFLHGLVDGVALIGDYKVDVPRGIGKRPLPQSIRIDWLPPWTVIAFVNYLPQWQSHLLEDSDVVSDVHQVGGIDRKGGNFLCDQ